MHESQEGLSTPLALWPVESDAVSLTSNPDTRECGLGEKRSSNLAEVKDEVDRITANYFSNIFL